jgi:hypothetical protein
MVSGLYNISSSRIQSMNPCKKKFSRHLLGPKDWTTSVGDLFLTSMNQEQGNTEMVKYYGPSSFVALSPLGYNEFRMKVMNDIPS